MVSSRTKVVVQTKYTGEVSLATIAFGIRIFISSLVFSVPLSITLVQLRMRLRLNCGKFKKSPELFLRMNIRYVLNMFNHINVVVSLMDHVLPLTIVNLRVKPEGCSILRFSI